MKRLNKRGFTLIEIVVIITLISIVGVFLTTFITPLFTISQGIYTETEAISMTNTIYNNLIQELKYLSEITSIEDNNAVLKYKTIYGELKSLNGNVFAEKAFPNREISVTFHSGGNFINVIIIIYDNKGNEITNTTKTIAPPNLAR